MRLERHLKGAVWVAVFNKNFPIFPGGFNMRDVHKCTLKGQLTHG